ncbi:MAG: hypothetical protein C4518_17090 [Desulfobacteraceae bacterium]|nr:MAG: hypothetical protein C4518_17090 [Desulfobacteraceae bacterium]
MFKQLVIYLHWRTLMAATWRALVAGFDWRAHIRRLTFRPVLDCVFISNMRDDVDRLRFLGKWRPSCGHFNCPRLWINGIAGRTRTIDVTTNDLATHEGREAARKLFIKTVEWSQKKGAKVILLAASTKRLFGDDAAELKKRFPELIFTLGDNGTLLLLMDETMRAIEKTKISPEKSRIAVLGPYGFLGEHITGMLVQKGYNVIGVGANGNGLEKIREKYGIDCFASLADMPEVSAIVACTHSEKVRLTDETVAFLAEKAKKKILVVDVAEPSNMKRSVYMKHRNKIIRQDAGNGYSPRLKYVLGPFSYLTFRLTKGVVFGCFAETLAIAFFLKKDKKIGSFDWMSINEKNMDIVRVMFAALDFGMPTPRNFGKAIKSFNLEITAKSITGDCHEGVLENSV